MSGGSVEGARELIPVSSDAIKGATYAPISVPVYTPSQATYYNPYIAMNQAYGNNPYAIMGGATHGQTTATTPTKDRVAQLDALSKAYMTSSDAAIAQQKADMIAQSNAAQLEYQRELAAKKAIEDSKAAEMTALLNQGYVWQNGQLVKPEYSYGGGFSGAEWTPGGKAGGLASLRGFE